MPYALFYPALFLAGMWIGVVYMQNQLIDARPKKVRKTRQQRRQEELAELEATDLFVKQLWDETGDDLNLQIWRHKWPTKKKVLAIGTRVQKMLTAYPHGGHSSVQRASISRYLHSRPEPLRKGRKVLAARRRQ